MNLFAGLEKFGLKADESATLFEEEKKTDMVMKKDGDGEEIPSEESFLLAKAIKCACCDQVFKKNIIKNGRIKRLEPDLDLRPRFQYIDTIKYDVVSCPHCGYTAMTRYFDHLASAQLKLIREKVCANFKPTATDEEPKILSYDEAIEQYKLSLFNTLVKRGKTSEKAFTCLKISWLLRGKYESLDPKDAALEEQRKACKEEEEAFYQQAFEGFMKAVSTEMFPICGMDQTTLDYLLAVMASHFKRYDTASKCISNVLTAASASKTMKDRAFDLKEKVIAEIKRDKQA